ncbi:MAG: hypothetical protein P0120_19300 [Nitrospira sp.]|nr:hypothetical protein [Nitrospira sp.]
MEPRETKAYLKQYIEVARGEPARRPREARGQACRSGVSAVAVEAFMNNVGDLARLTEGSSLAMIQLQIGYPD